MASKGYIIRKSVKYKKRNAKYCFYCWRPLCDSDNARGHLYATSPTIDHFIPLIKGGPNKQYNMVICCYQCNQTKGSMLPSQFNARINYFWQNGCFRYSKEELKNIMAQVQYIKSVYQRNMLLNQPYALMDLPLPIKKMGTLEQLRMKYIYNAN